MRGRHGAPSSNTDVTVDDLCQASSNIFTGRSPTGRDLGGSDRNIGDQRASQLRHWGIQDAPSSLAFTKVPKLLQPEFGDSSGTVVRNRASPGVSPTWPSLLLRRHHQALRSAASGPGEGSRTTTGCLACSTCTPHQRSMRRDPRCFIDLLFCSDDIRAPWSSRQGAPSPSPA